MAAYTNLDSSDDFITDTPPVQSQRRQWIATTSDDEISEKVLILQLESCLDQ